MWLMTLLLIELNWIQERTAFNSSFFFNWLAFRPLKGRWGEGGGRVEDNEQTMRTSSASPGSRVTVLVLRSLGGRCPLCSTPQKFSTMQAVADRRCPAPPDRQSIQFYRKDKKKIKTAAVGNRKVNRLCGARGIQRQEHLHYTCSTAQLTINSGTV